MSPESPPPTGCPRDTTFADFVAGRLAPTEAASLRQHAETCADCRELLAATQAASTGDAVLGAMLRGAAALIGTRIDRKYRLLRLLGEGGMGAVYEAEHAATGQRVAVKLIHTHLLADGENARRRFQREARTASAIEDPHFVRVLDAGEDEATSDLYLVMELLAGEDLQRLVDREGPLPPDVALRIAGQALAGLLKAHDAGIVHRDIKPANLFLARSGGGEVTVKVLDFGIAKITTELLQVAQISGLTSSGSLLGSPLYMSPEQMENSKGVDHRADLWSLGSALYCALAGRAPYRHVDNVFELLPAVRAGRAPALRELAPWVPIEVAAVTGRSLAVDPDQRYQSAGAMLEAIRGLVPEGLVLREEMLVGVSAEVRSQPSARPAPQGGAMISALARSEAPAPAALPRERGRRMGRRALLAGSGAALSLLALGGYVWRARARGAARPAVAEHRRLTFRGDASVPSFSPDGKSLAYAAGKKLVVRDLESGSERDVCAGRTPLDVEWLSDGSWLHVLDTDGDLWATHLVSRDGGVVRDVKLRGARRYSPAGKEALEFLAVQKDLRMFDVETDAPKGSLRLTGEFTWLEDVRWSPSGKWLLVVTTESSATHTFWAVRRDGAVQRRLSDDALALDHVRGEDFVMVQWSPRGDAFYYFREGPSETRELVKVAFDPSTGEAPGDRTVLLAGLEATHDLSIAADGKRLAYARRKYQTALWLVALDGPDGAGAARATKLDAGIAAKRAISVSPDGERVAYADFEGGVHVVTRALDGGAPRRVSSLEGFSDVMSMAWSADGAEIAFIATMKSGDSKLYKVPAGGGEVRALATAPVGTQVRWSPGRLLLYQTRGNRNFNALDPVSLQESPLVSKEAGWMFEPCSSGDGERVAVYWHRNDGQRSGLWSISRADGSSRFLAPDLDPVGYSPDGRTIYARRGGEARDLYLVPSEGGAPLRSVALPLEKPVDEIVLVPGTRRFVCTITDVDSDIWLVDDFDPEIAAR